jgi:hypothetical protein
MSQNRIMLSEEENGSDVSNLVFRVSPSSEAQSSLIVFVFGILASSDVLVVALLSWSDVPKLLRFRPKLFRPNPLFGGSGSRCPVAGRGKRRPSWSE